MKKNTEKTTEVKLSRKIVAAVMSVLYLAASSPVAAFAEEIKSSRALSADNASPSVSI